MTIIPILINKSSSIGMMKTNNSSQKRVIIITIIRKQIVMGLKRRMVGCLKC